MYIIMAVSINQPVKIFFAFQLKDAVAIVEFFAWLEKQVLLYNYALLYFLRELLLTVARLTFNSYDNYSKFYNFWFEY